MGMLFNSLETVDILRRFNAAFSGTGFSNLRTNPPGAFNVANLGSAYGAAIFDNICQPLGITSHHPRRWKFWCNLLDTTVDGSGQYYLAYLIGNAIGDALHNGNFDAVEFFACPANDGALSVEIADIQDPKAPGRLIKVVTVYTGIVDTFHGAPTPGT